MKKLTYKEAYDKIIEAYFKDEIIPLNPSFCFCGTLCNNTHEWSYRTREQHNDGFGYKGDDFVKMEEALLHTMMWGKREWYGGDRNRYDDPSLYEDALFAGMCAALEVLKQIHKERGEDVNGVQEFTKRGSLKY